MAHRKAKDGRYKPSSSPSRNDPFLSGPVEHALFLPFPPVCWMHFDPLFGRRVHPAAENTTAGEYQCVRRAALVEDRQLKVAVEGRCRYRLPFHDALDWELLSQTL